MAGFRASRSCRFWTCPPRSPSYAASCASSACAAPCSRRKQSEYVREGNIYFSCEVEERTLPYVIELVGEDRIFFASDFPHERARSDFLHDIPEFAERTDLSDRVKEKILLHNARRFYRLD